SPSSVRSAHRGILPGAAPAIGAVQCSDERGSWIGPRSRVTGSSAAATLVLSASQKNDCRPGVDFVHRIGDACRPSLEVVTVGFFLFRLVCNRVPDREIPPQWTR